MVNKTGKFKISSHFLYMMKLLLSGGGNPEETIELDQFFVDLFRDKKILFIPIAKTTRTPKECYDWVERIFKGKGFSGEMVLIYNLNEVGYDNIKEYDAIYIGGGNTFHLLKEIKSSGFDKLLKKYIMEKGFIYGVSAGAMIFCKDIGYAKEIGDINEDMIKDSSALNFFKDTYILPHYNSTQDNKINKLIKKEKIQIIALPEGSGIYIDNKKIYVKSGRAYLFTKEKKVEFKKNRVISGVNFNW